MGPVVGALVGDLVGALVGPLVVPLVGPLVGQGSLWPALCVAHPGSWSGLLHKKANTPGAVISGVRDGNRNRELSGLKNANAKRRVF